MKITKLALFLYFLFSITAAVANLMNWDGLKLLTKPLIIPALTFYYLGNVKKVALLPSLFLFFCFLGDAVALMDFDSEIVYLMGPFFMANLLVCLMAYQVRERFSWDVFNVFSLLLIFSFLIYLWKSVVSFFDNDLSNMQLYVGIFGFSLVLMNLITAFNCIWKMRLSSLFLLLTAVSFLVSQVFYVIYNYQFRLVVLDSLHFICQNLSYLFLVLFALNVSTDKKTVLT
ncbi:MAG: hypothetical protein RLZZ500_255 [Bacteroidota bacterium]|jgi:hypothetical protein